MFQKDPFAWMNDDGYDDDDVIRYPDIQIQIMIND
jgi:hypothetical protein